MKNTLLYTLILCCFFSTKGLAQTKKLDWFLPIERGIKGSPYLHKDNCLTYEVAVAKGRAKINKNFSLKKGYSAEFYEYKNYLIQVEVLDVKSMKSKGYTGVRKYYDTLLLEHKSDKKAYLDYRNLDQQESLIVNIKGINEYIFIIENSNYFVSGLIYSYDNKEEKTLQFVNDFVKTLRLR